MSSNLKVVFTSSITAKSFFTFKDKSLKILRSRLAFKYKCAGYNAINYGKPVQICEHLGTWHITGEKVKMDSIKLEEIQENLLYCNYSPFLEDVSILTKESNDFKMKIMESLLTEHDKYILKRGPLIAFRVILIASVVVVYSY